MRKTMLGKKVVAVMAVGALTCGMLVGCGKKEEKTNESAAAVSTVSTAEESEVSTAEVTENDVQTSASAGTIGTDEYTVSFDTNTFEAYEVERTGEIQLSYCKADVDAQGSNMIILSKEEGCTVEDIMSAIVEGTNGSSDQVYDGIIGEQAIPAKVYESSQVLEDNGLTLVDTCIAFQNNDDVIIIETIRTLSGDDEIDMTIDGAFIQVLESFTLN